MSNLQQTSLWAYRNEIKPTLGERQKAVYEALKTRENWTNKELAVWFNCDACSITGRVKELREMGLVVKDVVRDCKVTGRTAIGWKAI